MKKLLWKSLSPPKHFALVSSKTGWTPSHRVLLQCLILSTLQAGDCNTTLRKVHWPSELPETLYHMSDQLKPHLLFNSSLTTLSFDNLDFIFCSPHLHDWTGRSSCYTYYQIIFSNPNPVHVINFESSAVHNSLLCLATVSKWNWNCFIPQNCRPLTCFALLSKARLCSRLSLPVS